MPKAKRGRLSSIDLLPEESAPDIQWAYEEIAARRRPQLTILAELNARLADRGLNAISKSAFNRKVLWLVGRGDALIKAREVAAVMTEKLDDAPEGDVGLLLGEVIKSIVFDIVSEAQLTEKTSMNMMLQASVALDKLASARKNDFATREKMHKNFIKKATEAVEVAGKARGMSRDTIEGIKAKILGIDLEPKQ